MKDKKIQWHPGFVAAMNLELVGNRDDLIFEKEHNLNTKPLEIDLLIVKKEASVHIVNEIGSFFRGHNIIEYKSPDDHLDIDTFYKVGAYASLYKSYGKTLDERKADDITVSLVREAKPEGLFQYFHRNGYSVSNPEKGIYYVSGKVLFPTQIVVTKELDREKHIWLRVLSGKLERQDLEELVGRIRRLSGKEDREFADSVFQVSIDANQQVMEELKGDVAMCQALLELMEPELRLRDEEKIKEGLQRGLQQGLQQGVQQGLQQGLQQGVQQGLQQGIQGTVDVLRKCGHGKAEIKKIIMEQYNIPADEAEKYF